jgi:hypothetical protein
MQVTANAGGQKVSGWIPGTARHREAAEPKLVTRSSLGSITGRIPRLQRTNIQPQLREDRHRGGMRDRCLSLGTNDKGE